MMTRQQYLLVCLMEECNEVAQRASKAARFGMNEIQPGQPDDNGKRIFVEMCDLFAVIQILIDEGLMEDPKTTASEHQKAIAAKVAKVNKYFDYAVSQGQASATR